MGRRGKRMWASWTAGVALLAVAGVPPASSHPPHATRHPANGFSPAGYWNSKLPKHVPLAPNSAAIVANIAQDKVENYGVFAVNTDEWSTPIFTVGKDVKRTTWTYSNCLGMPELAPQFADTLSSVPTPDNLFTSLGTDQTVTIYQPSTNTYWDFWRAQQKPDGGWEACWGGRIDGYRQNPGVHTYPLGAAATGLPHGAYVIRIEELRRGYIDHAIGLLTVRVRKDCISWPATRTDGFVEGDDLPCEGQRFRLDPAFDVSTLTSPAARTIARAMQEYGMVLTDKSGAVTTWAEDPRLEMAANGGVDPYVELFDPDDLAPDGLEKYVVLSEIPIDRFQALPLDWGKPKDRPVLSPRP